MSKPSLEIMSAIVAGHHRDPFAVLGPHVIETNDETAVVIRAFRPLARTLGVMEGERVTPMQQVHEAGLFESVFPNREQVFRYKLLEVRANGEERERDDPYAFPPILSDLDLHLLGEGRHYRSYEKLGAHLREVEDVRGVHFAVWAPNAGRVSIIGAFNDWDGRANVMRFHAGAGIWEIFIPDLDEGTPYKYEVLTSDMRGKLDKSDPYVFYAELRPSTASIVFDIDRYHWRDDDWMQTRKRWNALDAPIAIYEVHLGSWRRRGLRPPSQTEEVGGGDEGWLTYRELAHALVDYVKQMGYTHIELLPICEHPYDGSWGYQTTGYYAPTSRFGTPRDFMYFVDHCHQNGIGVYLDWVPGHFPKDAHGLNYFDGTHLYEHPDPRMGVQPDWGTLIFNYGRKEVRNFLLSNALFWLEKYHIDGLRVDAVASMLYLDYSRQPGQWLPNKYGGRENLEAIDFLKRFNELVHAEHLGAVTMAEESTSWPLVSHPEYLGGLGFDMKWNMGWMHDMLGYMSQDPIYRRYHHHRITFSLMYAFSENFILPLSHDEVVHLKKSLLDKMPGDLWRKFANLRAFYSYMYTHPGKKLLFMGGEFGQWREWSEERSLDWHLLDSSKASGQAHRQLQRFVADLNQLYRSEAALHEVDFQWSGFQWIDLHDVEQSTIAFVRRAKDKEDFVVVVCNFTPVPHFGYRVGVPARGEYHELLNSDSEYYGGSNLGNGLGVPADELAWQGQPYSLLLTLPPLATIILKMDKANSPAQPHSLGGRMLDLPATSGAP